MLHYRCTRQHPHHAKATIDDFLSGAVRPANFPFPTQSFQKANDHVADIRLTPGPSEAGRPWPCMMIAMPILALEQMHQRKPSHIAAGVFARCDLALAMAHAVDEALRVQREHQP